MSNPVYADSLNLEESNSPADQEIDKSGDVIEDEIEVDREEFESNELKEIDEGSGGLYDAYREEFDEWEDKYPGAGIYVDLLKNFDYHKGSFDCGRFDVLCHVTNIVFVGGSSIINAFLSPISQLAISPEEIMDDSSLNKFLNAINSFTTSLLSVFILFQIIKIYSFRLTDHMDTVNVLNEKIIKIVLAAVFLFTYEYFFRFLLSIQYRVNYGIFNYISNSTELTNTLMLNLILTPNGIMFVLLLLVFAVLLAVLFFQMIYSFALIGLLYTVGPAAITTMVNDEYNLFSLWLRTIISRFLTLALQGLSVILCLSFASRIDFVLEGGSMSDAFFSKILALAFLVVGLAIPSLLKEFGSSSGSGRGAMSGAKTATRVVTRR